MRQRAIYLFNCCTDARPINGRPISPHFFIILSGTEYNKKSKEYITAIPCSSKVNKLSTEWYQVEINEGDLESFSPASGFLSEKTYVLADRPSRLAKANIKNDVIVAEINYSRYKEIIEHIAKFMKEAN